MPDSKVANFVRRFTTCTSLCRISAVGKACLRSANCPMRAVTLHSGMRPSAESDMRKPDNSCHRSCCGHTMREGRRPNARTGSHAPPSGHSPLGEQRHPTNSDSRREPPKSVTGIPKGAAFMEGDPTVHRPKQADGCKYQRVARKQRPPWVRESKGPGLALWRRLLRQSRNRQGTFRCQGVHRGSGDSGPCESKAQTPV
ncbi:MAG: hypothetical protein RL173_1916 [Fibrobacterota bacterium]|jgi:hypothetical protein